MKNVAETIYKDCGLKVPIGTLLLADGLIVQQDLEFALEHQKHSKQLLGEILVRIGALKRADLARALELQKRIRFNQ